MCTGGEWTYTCNAETKGDVSGGSQEHPACLAAPARLAATLRVSSPQRCAQVALLRPGTYLVCIATARAAHLLLSRMLGRSLSGRQHVSASHP